MSYAAVRALYDRVQDLDPQARRALFDAESIAPDLRAEVEALLAGTAAVADPISARIERAAQRTLEGALPERIGAWRVLDTLGEGGMGLVLLGARADGEFEMRVAIKLIRGYASDALRERFRRERQVLAVLDHPNIAGLLDGGTTAAGEPYLVMPYIEGETLPVWLARSTPSLRARLVLFVVLCRAVHYAHQHLVVHRDLKPGNVMVRADGSPVLLDFGIAKLLDATAEPADRTATRLMTPMYASPEQLLGRPVTTATDVYGLGLVLYELLAGAVPKRGEIAQAASTELPPPSKLAQHAALEALRADAARIRGDLDKIARRAVRTDPAARYPSALALAEDVAAYLDGRPVQAAGGQRLYLLGRFLRRHRWAVAAGVAGVAALVAFSVQLKFERDRARVAEHRATREAQAANEVTEFLVGLFDEIDPHAQPGRQLAATELLDIGRARIAEFPDARAELRSRLQESLGRIYANAGQSLPAIELLEAARAELLQADAPARLVSAETTLARAYNEAGRHAQALPIVEHAARLAESATMDEPLLLAHALMVRGVAEQSLARTADAEASFARAQALFEAAGARAALASVLHNRGWLAHARGDYGAALAWYERSIAEKHATIGADHPKTLTSLKGRGMALVELGRLADAAAAFEDLRERTVRVHGELSQPMQAVHNELASLSQDLGDYARAQRHYEASLELARRLAGDAESIDLAVGLNNLASLLEERGDLAAAESHYRESLRMRDALWPAGHPSTAVPRHNLARLLLAQARLDDASGLLDAALAIRRDRFDPAHPLRLGSELLQAQWLIDAGQLDAAEALLTEVGARLDANREPLALLRASREETRARLAAAGGDRAAAHAAWRTATELAARQLPATHPRLAQLELARAEAALADGASAEARQGVASIGPILRGALVDTAPVLARLAALEQRLAAAP